MLISINIQNSEEMIIDISQRKLIIINCTDFITAIKVFSFDKRVDRIIKNKRQIFLLFQSVTNVFIQVRDNFELSTSRNYMFYSEAFFDLGSEGDVFTHIVDANISMVQIRNVTHKATIIFCYAKLERVINYEKKRCYLASLKNAHLVVKPKKQMFKNFFKLVLIGLVIAAMFAGVNNLPPSISSITNVGNLPPASLATTSSNSPLSIWPETISNSSLPVFLTTSVDNLPSLISQASTPAISVMKVITSRDITIYSDETIRAKLEAIIDRFSEL